MSEPDNLVQLLPLPGVADGGIPRPRGRPKKVEPKPTRADIEHHAQVARAQAEHVEADEVVRAVVEGRDPQEVLRRASEALARQAAVLEHQRQQLDLRGVATGAAQLVSRRANVLVQLARLQIQMQELDPKVIDLRSDPMIRVFRTWFETLTQVAQDVLPPEQFDVFINRLETALHGWEDETEAKLR